MIAGAIARADQSCAAATAHAEELVAAARECAEGIIDLYETFLDCGLQPQDAFISVVDMAHETRVALGEPDSDDA